LEIGGQAGRFSDVHVTSMVWLVMIGDFQNRGNFSSVPRHPRVEGNYPLVTEPHSALSAQELGPVEMRASASVDFGTLSL